MKKLCVAMLAVVCGLCAAYGKPVKSDVGGREDLGYIEEGPKNYWVWPTEAITRGGIGPTTVWNPEVGVWYTGIAANGYVRALVKGSYTENSVTTKIDAGYAMGAFVALEPGRYGLSCNTDGDTQVRLGFYKEVEGGFMAGTWITLSRQSVGGWYNKTFTVPEGCSLVLLVPSPYDSTTTLTTTDIEIYRID